MDSFWEDLGKAGGSFFAFVGTILGKTLKLAAFFLLAILFIPSFLIVTTFSKTWNGLLKELFGL